MKRFDCLDGLRGIAALTVVMWHWQHFSFNGANPDPAFNSTAQPFYSTLALFYRHGWLAVDLFFSLSGFIFYWLYARAISLRAVTPMSFAVRRFARLYPLHLATLLAVLIGQGVAVRVMRTAFVYTRIDTYHFILNLLFANDWGLQYDYSFNGPSWSLSIEVLLYVLFFLVCRFITPRLWAAALGAAIGLGLQLKYEHLGRGIGSFYLGGAVYFAYEWLLPKGKRMSAAITLLTALLWCGTLVCVYTPGIDTTGLHPRLFTLAVLFPMTILALSLVESRVPKIKHQFRLLGDISYSSYLLHFPLQLYTAVTIAACGLNRSIYLSRLFFLAFFAMLITLSHLSHRWLEMPAQRFVRARGDAFRIKSRK